MRSAPICSTTSIHSSRRPTSALPHVRSDIGFYLKEGKIGIFDGQGDYLFNIAPDWYGRVSGGLLEYMYAGVDGEVLCRPYDQRYAIGLDVNHVIKRGFNDLFGSADLSGHRGTAQLLLQAAILQSHGGAPCRALPRRRQGCHDRAVARLRGGVRAGIFATKTNVSAAQFGEGSFDKGFFISFPLDSAARQPERERGELSLSATDPRWRPICGDLASRFIRMTDGYDPETLSHMWPQLLK